jgi:hypothetical protein
VLRDVPDSTEVNLHGTQVHAAIARHLQDGEPLPLGMRQYEQAIQPWRDEVEGYPLVEQKLAMSKDGRPVDWRSRDVWVRAVIDYAKISDRRAVVVDWKTGRPKDGTDQLQVMAIVLMAHMKELDEVGGALVWLQEGWATEDCIRRTDLPRVLADLWPRVVRFEQAHVKEEFPARPNGLCKRWCSVRACPHHGR